MAIKVVRNAAGNCVNFLGSTNPVYWNACLTGEVDGDDANRVNVINNIRTAETGTTVYEFYQIPYTDFAEADGTAFATASDCAAYITAQCNAAANTGQFVLSATDTLDFRLDSTGTTILVDNGDAYAVNAIRAVGNSDGHINIIQHTGDVAIFTDLRVANASIDNTAVTNVLNTAVNELNALFQQGGTGSGTAPVITSPLTVSLTAGETLNYELTATGGVAYEWTSLPAGVATVDGNVRRLIGGSALTAGTYNVTARAINYFGVDEETVSIVVSSPTFSNTKSINFNTQQYLDGSAASVSGIMGRSADGAGAGDAWSVSTWFKPGTDANQQQTIWFYGDTTGDTNGFIRLRYFGRNTQKIGLIYGNNDNQLVLNTPNDSLTGGTWSHILVTYDGGTTGAAEYSRFNIYIDGVLQTTSDSNIGGGFSGATGSDLWRFGRCAGNQWLRDGRIDEVAIWGSDQSANVAAIYNTGSTHDLSLLASAPAHWWRMGDGDTYPTISDNVGAVDMTMTNQIAGDIVTDAP